MDIIQLVFGFGERRRFCDLPAGDVLERATSHGAFFGLLGGTLTSALFHALIGGWQHPGVKAAISGVVQVFPSDMAQNFWLAAVRVHPCFVLTLVHLAGDAADEDRRRTQGLGLFADAGRS